jgi:hypothetical protein
VPRSPSRDLSDRHIGRRRYFRRWNDVERWKLWLSAVAAVLVAGWAVASFGWKRETETQLTHGPLAAAHAAWDATCEACHRNEKAFDLSPAERWNSFTCQKCHAAPTHHASIPQGDPAHVETGNCASCHHDHQGRTNSLVKLTDNHCVRCHSHLASSAYAPKITSFTTDHPDFRPLAKPRPSTIKFSHAQHLTPGMAEVPGSKAAMTLAMLKDLSPRAEGYRKPGQKDTDLVTLDCKSCHTTSPDGKSFALVKYEASCVACHPVSTPSVVKAGMQVVDPFAVPHAVQVKDLSVRIEAEYSRLFQSEHKSLFTQPNPFGPAKKNDPAVKAFRQDVADAVKQAKGFLETNCKKCHMTDTETVKPAGIPYVWMTHAKFDHAAHRMADCASCHPTAVAGFVAGKPDHEREPVNILGVESCKTCHAPKAGATGGIRHACTDCHTFHGGDDPHKKRGDPAFAPQTKLKWDEFLRGK